MGTKEIIKRNPKVDPKQLGDLQRTLKELRDHGIEPDGYRIPLPHTDEVAPRTEKDDSKKIGYLSR